MPWYSQAIAPQPGYTRAMRFCNQIQVDGHDIHSFGDRPIPSVILRYGILCIQSESIHADARDSLNLLPSLPFSLPSQFAMNCVLTVDNRHTLA
jgi:hypothetical protein